jgi:hypothetical protein
MAIMQWIYSGYSAIKQNTVQDKRSADLSKFANHVSDILYNREFAFSQNCLTLTAPVMQSRDAFMRHLMTAIVLHFLVLIITKCPQIGNLVCKNYWSTTYLSGKENYLLLIKLHACETKTAKIFTYRLQV